MFLRLLLCSAILLSALPAISAEGSNAIYERAETLREQGRELREQTADRFRRKEAECYTKFFVNACLDKAHEERIAALNEARKLEIAGKQMELEEKRRLAAERGADVHVQERPIPTPTAIPEPAANPEARRIRAERQRTLKQAQAEQRRKAAEQAKVEQDKKEAAAAERDTP